MEEKNLKAKEKNRSYEPPKANFVPLKLEERLTACARIPGDTQGCNNNPGTS